MLIVKPAFRAAVSTPARSRQAAPAQAYASVAANITESPDAYTIALLAPGLEKADFKVQVEKDLLSISAEKSFAVVEGSTVLRREFGDYRFSRSFKLPNTVDAANISGQYTNGILTVQLPKREEAKAQAPTSIAVQ